MQDLGTLGGQNSYAQKVNWRGQVTGPAETGEFPGDDQPVNHAFIWSP